MRLVVAICCGLVLAGCATEADVVMPGNLRTEMRQQSTAVVFTDDVREVRFTWGRFNTPGLNRPDSFLPYDGELNIDPILSAVHAEELGKLGIHTTSVYDLLEGSTVERLTLPGRENRSKNYEMTPFVSPDLATALINKGQRYLLWVTWSGLRYFHTVLSTTPVEQISSSYWLFDLQARSLLWSGSLVDIRDSDFKNSEAKARLEDGHFAGLERLVENRYRLAYQDKDDSVPWLLGLVVN
jgi:hypothetical protein